MLRTKFTHNGFNVVFKVELGRVADPDQAKMRGSFRPAFLRLTMSEPNARAGDLLVDLWDEIDIDLDWGDETLRSKLSAKRSALLEEATAQASALRPIRASEREAEQRIEKILDHVA